MDSILTAIVLATTIGASPPIELYLMDHHWLQISVNSRGEPRRQYANLEEKKLYIWSDGEIEIVELEDQQYGQVRGWSIEEHKLQGREIVKDTSCLGMECQVVREIYNVSALPMAEEGALQKIMLCMCKSPEIEALPLQTRLQTHLYKEWINKEYPLLVKSWIDPSPDPSITILEVKAIEQRPFPIDRVREWFGVEVE